DHARPELLGELVRTLLPEHPELEVHTEVQRVLEVPHGSTLVLVPRAEDADWLNINRPVFAQRELRVVLFCDTETTVALARQAVDFFDWISHRVECPSRPPRFAVAGIRCALAARAPGIVWQGGDLEATFAVARPHGRIHKVSAARPYGELLGELRAHREAWVALSEVNSPFRLRHVRWALAEVGYRTRAILLEPTDPSPGWWPVHAHLAELREARAQLEKAGATHPGRLAALNELEPEAITLMCLYLGNGIEAETLEAVLLGRKVPGLEQKTSLEDIGRELAPQFLRGEATPLLMRAFTPKHIRQLIQQELTTIHQQMDKGEPVEFSELAGWAAWTTRPELAPSARSPEFAIELSLRNREPAQVRWTELTTWAVTMEDLDVAESWAWRAIAEKQPYARLALASVLLAQGHHDKAEPLIQEALANEGQTPGWERAVSTNIPSLLANMLLEREKYSEAEALLRKALSAIAHDGDGEDLLSGALRYQLAKALSGQENYNEAESLLRQALATSKQPQGINLLSQGLQLDELAKVIANLGRYAEAEALLRQSLAILQSTLAPEHPAFGTSLHDLATILRLRGKHAEAEPLFRQALSIKEQTLGVEHRSYTGSLSGLAMSLRAQGKYEEAEAKQRQALASEELALGSEHPAYGMSLHGLACILRDQAKYAEAETLFRRALAIKERALGPSHQALCAPLSNLGAIIAQQGRPDEGAPFILRAVEIAEAKLGHDHPETAKALNLLAQLQDASGNEEAPKTARTALDALQRALGPDHPTTQRVSPMLQAIIAKAHETPSTREQ
ncbi:MAG TPA: tetratricopeptide repeat protein, partial [Archangium sp.]|nr:tetratricopeptide repeat protein [Archangium sp.]